MTHSYCRTLVPSPKSVPKPLILTVVGALVWVALAGCGTPEHVYDRRGARGSICVAITPECDPETGLHCKTKCTVEGEAPNFCAQVEFLYVAPLEAGLGDEIILEGIASDREGDPISYSWTASEGEMIEPDLKETKYVCQSPGIVEFVLTLNDDTPCKSAEVVQVICAEPEFDPSPP